MNMFIQLSFQGFQWNG